MAAHSAQRPTRRGSVSLEAVMVLVVLIVATFAAVEFGLALVVKQAISHAATVAAREAAKGADSEDLEAVVEQVLEGHRIDIGEYASLVLENGPNPNDRVQRGDPECNPPATPVLDPDEVRVTLCVSLDAPPFVNGLARFGIDLSGLKFQVSSVATIE